MRRQNTLEQIVDAGTEALRHSLYICMPGSVVAYHADTQTADVQPMVNDPRVDIETGAIVFEPWGVIYNVPVCWPRFGGFVIAGPLKQYDQVVLEAFDLDPTPWRAQGRSGKPVNPGDVERLGGGYWRAVPTDLTGPMQSAGAAANGMVIGADGNSAQIVFNPGSIQLGSSGGDAVALASKVDQAVATIVSVFNAHAHTSAAPGSPTTPPITPISPAPMSTASSLVKAQ
jgi:hypothetical protein